MKLKTILFLIVPIAILVLFSVDSSVEAQALITLYRASLTSSLSELDNDAFHIGISGNGRYVAFYSFATNVVPGDTRGTDLYISDLETGLVEKVSGPNSIFGPDTSSSSPNGVSLSCDGRFIAFATYAGSLVENDSNGLNDVYLFDRQENSYELISVNIFGNAGGMSTAQKFPAMVGMLLSTLMPII